MALPKHRTALCTATKAMCNKCCKINDHTIKTLHRCSSSHCPGETPSPAQPSPSDFRGSEAEAQGTSNTLIPWDFGGSCHSPAWPSDRAEHHHAASSTRPSSAITSRSQPRTKASQAHHIFSSPLTLFAEF